MPVAEHIPQDVVAKLQTAGQFSSRFGSTVVRQVLRGSAKREDTIEVDHMAVRSFFLPRLQIGQCFVTFSVGDLTLVLSQLWTAPSFPKDWERPVSTLSRRATTETDRSLKSCRVAGCFLQADYCCFPTQASVCRQQEAVQQQVMTHVSPSFSIRQAELSVAQLATIRPGTSLRLLQQANSKYRMGLEEFLLEAIPER